MARKESRYISDKKIAFRAIVDVNESTRDRFQCTLEMVISPRLGFSQSPPSFDRSRGGLPPFNKKFVNRYTGLRSYVPGPRWVGLSRFFKSGNKNRRREESKDKRKNNSLFHKNSKVSENHQIWLIMIS